MNSHPPLPAQKARTGVFAGSTDPWDTLAKGRAVWLVFCQQQLLLSLTAQDLIWNWYCHSSWKPKIVWRLPMHLLNVKWVMYVTQINVAKVSHQSNIRTLIFHAKIIILATLFPYQQEKRRKMLLWNQCCQDYSFWVKNQCSYIALVSYFGNIYFCDKHDPFDIYDAAR